MKRTETIRIITAVMLIISLFCTVDLGMNFCYNLYPQAHDGYTVNSILHGVFCIFGDNGWTLDKFYTAFQTSAWLSFIIASANLLIGIYIGKKTD